MLDFAHPFRSLNVLTLVLEINEDPYSQDDGQWKGNFVEGTQSLLNVSNFLDALEMDLEKVARAGGGGGAGGLGSEEEKKRWFHQLAWCIECISRGERLEACSSSNQFYLALTEVLLIFIPGEVNGNLLQYILAWKIP